MPYTLLAILAVVLFAICCILAVMLVAHRIKAKKERKETELFLSTVAHDLRSPLTNVKGFADALLSGTIDGERKEQALAVISLEAARLASLSDRLCGGDIEVNPGVFSICELLRSIFLSLERKIQQRGLELTFSFGDDDEIYVRADKDIIHEALYNICDNAIKYSVGKEISVSVRLDGAFSVISVSNKTDDTSFSDYFTPGKRGNNSGKGKGLGLYISEKLIRSSGSALTVKKADGEISFSFALPYEEEQ